MTSRAERVAALYDIHGNLPALEAVLRDIHDAGVDHIVVGGDVIPGPMPREALETLFELDVPVSFIHGNGEREVLARLAGIETGAVPERFREVIRWVGQQLPDRYVELLESWPPTLAVDVRGVGQVLFCHATPRDDNEIFTRLTPEDRLVPVFEPVRARVVVCGHTHMQFDRAIGTTRVVNAGSVGMPFGEPGAFRGTGRVLAHGGTRPRAAPDQLRHRGGGRARARYGVSTRARVRGGERPAVPGRGRDARGVRAGGAPIIGCCAGAWPQSRKSRAAVPSRHGLWSPARGALLLVAPTFVGCAGLT